MLFLIRSPSNNGKGGQFDLILVVIAVCFAVAVQQCEAVCRMECNNFCPTVPPITTGTVTTAIRFTEQNVTTEKRPTGLLTNEPVFSVIVVGIVVFLSVLVLCLAFCIVHIQKKKDDEKPWSKRSVAAQVMANGRHREGIKAWSMHNTNYLSYCFAFSYRWQRASSSQLHFGLNNCNISGTL